MLVERLKWLQDVTERLARAMAGLGATIIVVQMVWIAYGVMMRYAFRSPDRLATEATALLLFPVAFVGLGYALNEGAMPRVTLLADTLPQRLKGLLDLANMMAMTAIGAFFATAAVRATFRAYSSGAASEVLVWPKFVFWAPAALALVIFTANAAFSAALLLIAAINKEGRSNGMV